MLSEETYEYVDGGSVTIDGAIAIDVGDPPDAAITANQGTYLYADAVGNVAVKLASDCKYMMLDGNGYMWETERSSTLTAPVAVRVMPGTYIERVVLPDYIYLIGEGMPKIEGAVYMGKHTRVEGIDIDCDAGNKLEGFGAVWAQCQARDIEDIVVTRCILRGDAQVVASYEDSAAAVVGERIPNLITGLHVDNNRVISSNPFWIQSEMYNCSFDNNLWEYDGDATSCYGLIDKPASGSETRRVSVCGNRFNVKSSGPITLYFANIGGSAWNFSNNRGLFTSTNATVASFKFLRVEEGIDPAIGDDADVPNQVTGNHVIHSCPNGIAANAYTQGIVALGNLQPLARLKLADNFIQSDCSAGSGTDKRIESTSQTIDLYQNGLGGLMDVADDLTTATLNDYSDAVLSATPTNGVANVYATNEITFSGSVVDAELVLSGILVYEFDTGNGIDPGGIVVDVSADQSATAAALALIDAINGQATEDFTASSGGAGIVTMTAKIAGAAGNTIAAPTCLGNNYSITGDPANFTGGVDAVEGTPGVAGQMKQDGDFIYVCITSGTVYTAVWKKIALAALDA